MAFDLFQSEYKLGFDGFMLVVQCDTKFDGHELRVGTPRKFLQNVLFVMKFCYPYTRGSWGKRKKKKTLNHAPQDWTSAGVRFQDVTLISPEP